MENYSVQNKWPNNVLYIYRILAEKLGQLIWEPMFFLPLLLPLVIFSTRRQRPSNLGAPTPTWSQSEAAENAAGRPSAFHRRHSAVPESRSTSAGGSGEVRRPPGWSIGCRSCARSASARTGTGSLWSAKCVNILGEFSRVLKILLSAFINQKSIFCH
jgi:hypothetical protein